MREPFFRGTMLISIALLLVGLSVRHAPAITLAHPLDLPPRPIATPIAARGPAAELCLRMTAAPNSTVRPSEIATYHLVVHNNGRGKANSVQLSLPFTPDMQEILDASFTSSRAWVTAIQTDAVKIQLGALGSNETITSTLRLHIKSTVPQGMILTTRANMQWFDGRAGGTGLSNRLSLIVAAANRDKSTVALDISPTIGPPTTRFSFAYDGFASNEHVSLWYRRPDGTDIATGELLADGQGQIASSISVASFPPGRYSMIAYGQCSQTPAIGIFTITSK